MVRLSLAKSARKAFVLMSMLAACLACDLVAGESDEPYRFIISGSTESSPLAVATSPAVSLVGTAMTSAASDGTWLDFLNKFGLMLLFK